MGPPPERSRLVRDEQENRADQPGPTGEGTREGVDYEVHKPEAGLTEEEIADRKSLITLDSDGEEDNVVENGHPEGDHKPGKNEKGISS